MISWCFSTTCDLAMMLRREGVFGTMFATFDLRTITEDPNAELSEQQRGVLEYKRYNPEMKDVVLYGPFGVGKTILLCELAKAAMAEEGWETATVRIYCDTVGPDYKLREHFEDTFKPVERRDLKVVREDELEEEFPGTSHLLVRIGRKMEEGGARLIIVVDEFEGDFDDKMVDDLKAFKNTKFLLALRASGYSAIDQQLKRLKSSRQQQIVELRSQYRNTEKILAFLRFQREFAEEVRKATDNPDYKLPGNPETIKADPASTPQSLSKPLPSSPHPVVWLPAEKDRVVTETLEAMKRILPTGDQGLDVVVLYLANYKSAAEEICNAGKRELGTHTWKHFHAYIYIGCEAPVVILLGDYGFWMEHISRARNQLVIVTTGKEMELTEEFYSTYEHRGSKYSFSATNERGGGDVRDMLQLSADLEKVHKMGDERIFL